MTDSVQSQDATKTFFDTLLTPGSSLHPTFLLVLDAAFGLLLSIFFALLWLTSGSIHIVVLIGVELGLWASVKWFVRELKAVQSQQQSAPDAISGTGPSFKQKVQ